MLLVLLISVFFIFADGCEINNGEYAVNISYEAYEECPLPVEKINVDGWERIISGEFGETKVKLLKAGYPDNVSDINWTLSASNFMQKEGGIILKQEACSVSSFGGVKVTANFAHGTGVIVDVPLKNNNLLEILSRDRQEAEDILNTIYIESTYTSQ